MIRTSIFAAAALAFVLPAAAGVFTVTLEEPVTERTRHVADGAVWICEGETCTADLKRSKVSVRACREIADEAGRLTAYSNGSDQLDAEELDRCNKAAG